MKEEKWLRIIYCLFNFCWGSHSFPTTNHFLPSLYIFVRQPIQQEIMAASSAVQFIMYLTVYLIKYFEEIITTWNIKVMIFNTRKQELRKKKNLFHNLYSVTKLKFTVEIKTCVGLEHKQGKHWLRANIFGYNSFFLVIIV